jgi:hypothetical protein
MAIFSSSYDEVDATMTIHRLAEKVTDQDPGPYSRVKGPFSSETAFA